MLLLGMKGAFQLPKDKLLLLLAIPGKLCLTSSFCSRRYASLSPLSFLPGPRECCRYLGNLEHY